MCEVFVLYSNPCTFIKFSVFHLSCLKDVGKCLHNQPFTVCLEKKCLKCFRIGTRFTCTQEKTCNCVTVEH